MDSIKRRVRSHFWFPTLNNQVESTVQKCKSCQLFTKKTTREPVAPQRLPNRPWEEVCLDLFGPMLDNKHILVALDNYSRFPAAKIVPSTAAKPVLKALHGIYTDFGTPERHRTDNGTPFNSKDFASFSSKHNIQHDTSYQYHPQGNPAETFMKPLGKAMKTAFHEGRDRETALNELLGSYRSTPHSASQLSPGGVLFYNGYRKDFTRKQHTEAERRAAKEKDHQQRRERKQTTNQSPRRRPTDISQGDLVLVLNNTRSTKYQPIYHQTPYWVDEVSKRGVVMRRTTDNKQIRRHKDDVKLYYGTVENDNHHQQDEHTTIWLFPVTSEQNADSDTAVTEEVRNQRLDYDSDATIPYKGDIENAEEDQPIEVNKRRRKMPRHLESYELS